MKANGLFSGTLPWWKTAPLKRPMKRAMNLDTPIANHNRNDVRYRRSEIAQFDLRIR